MAVSTVSKHPSFKVTLPSDREILMTRVFDAPRDLVFEALTKPEHVRQWWGCLDGYTVPVCEMDVRVGGRWRIVNTGPDGEVAFHGEYLEIVKPALVRNTEIFEMYPDTVSYVTVTLTEQDGKTTYQSLAEYPSREIRDMVLQTGMEDGAALSLDRLGEIAQSLQKR